jgi:hypothetical protein
VSRRRKVRGALLTRDLAIATLSLLFSLWVTAASGYAAVYQALREREGLVSEPVEYDPDIPAAEMVHS